METTPTSPQYILEIHVVQCMKFKGVFAVIKELLFDCNIWFDETGMKICNLDNSKVALIYFKAQSDARAFSRYYCERPQMYGISVIALHKYLGFISQNNSKYTLKLLVDRDRAFEMIIEIVSDDDTDTQRYYMKLLDLPEDEGSLNAERFTCIINIPSAKLQKYCRSHALVGDVIDIMTVGDQVELSTEDTDGGDRSKSIIKTSDEDSDDDVDMDDDGDVDDDDNNNIINNDVDADDQGEEAHPPPRRGRGAVKRRRATAASKKKTATARKTATSAEDKEKKKTSILVTNKDEPIAGRFSLRFLQMFAKAQNLSPNVVIYFKKDYPLVLQYKIGELGELKFALAPRLSPAEM